jgi:hypothetical protein
MVRVDETQLNLLRSVSSRLIERFIEEMEKQKLLQFDSSLVDLNFRFS